MLRTFFAGLQTDFDKMVWILPLIKDKDPLGGLDQNLDNDPKHYKLFIINRKESK